MGNHHGKQGLKRISSTSQFTIPHMAGTTHDHAGINTNTMSSNPNQACHTPDYSYPHVSSILFPTLFLASLSCPQLYNHCRTQSHVIPLYISKMYFCLWEPLGVTGSCRNRIPGWSNYRVYWTDAVAFRCTWEDQR